MRIFKLAAAAVLSCSATLALAGGDAGGTSATASNTLNNAATKAISRTISRGGERCARLETVYRYDCYRQVYRRAGQQVRGNTAYSEVARAMDQVERAIDTAVTRNLDPTAPTKRRGLETYRPVKPSAEARVQQQSWQAIEQAKKVLLRSPASKQQHYTRIVAALDSNKTLLRSTLLPEGVIKGTVRLVAAFVGRAVA